jgi:hypothetical protein
LEHGTALRCPIGLQAQNDFLKRTWGVHVEAFLEVAFSIGNRTARVNQTSCPIQGALGWAFVNVFARDSRAKFC